VKDSQKINMKYMSQVAGFGKKLIKMDMVGI
jgi:hypothetical protein